MGDFSPHKKGGRSHAAPLQGSLEAKNHLRAVHIRKHRSRMLSKALQKARNPKQGRARGSVRNLFRQFHQSLKVTSSDQRREASRHGADARKFRSANHREPHEATQSPPISVSGNRTFQGSEKPWPVLPHYSLSRDKPPMNFGGEPSAHCLRYGQAPRDRRSDARPFKDS